MGRGRLLGGCAWLLGGLALLQTLYLRALPHPRPPLTHPHPQHPPHRPHPPRGVLDASGTFRIYRDVLGPPPRWAPPELVLATHGSPGRVALALGGALGDGGGGWGGPLSVAVLGVPPGGLRQLLALLGGPCRGLRGRLRLHVVVGAAAPLPQPASPPPHRPGPPAPGGCRGALRRLAAADPPSYTLGVPYPGNLLRNVAWGGAAGEGEGQEEGRGRWGDPPQRGAGEGRFVLLLDADVVPSRGLHEEFLGLLRRGAGAWTTPPGRGEPHGGLGVPRALTLPPAMPGVPKDPPDGVGVPKNSPDAGVPNTLGVPNVLKDPKNFHTPEVPKGRYDLGVPNAPEVPNHLEVPKGLRDLAVPNALKNPDALEVPNALKNPNALEDPNTLDVTKSSHDLEDLKDPKNFHTLEVPKGLHDPGVPNALEDPNALEVPNALKNPNALEDPNTLDVTKSSRDSEDLKDPKNVRTLEVPKGLHDPGVPNALEAPEAPGAAAAAPWWARVVFVLPAFEVQAGVRLPGTKGELLRLWGAGDARPFYGALCPRCQAPTGYGRWRALPPTPRLAVAYEVPWRDPWEPFYVGPARGVPPFDERFLQYGFNRISQACELHVAGFRFAVLDGAFVVHRGFKEAGTFHAGREAELGRNRQLFRSFRHDLHRRYPHSPRRC